MLAVAAVGEELAWRIHVAPYHRKPFKPSLQGEASGMGDYHISRVAGIASERYLAALLCCLVGEWEGEGGKGIIGSKGLAMACMGPKQYEYEYEYGHVL